MSSTGALTLWRVFPWDRDAAEGAPFSPSFVPEPTGRGRFDLPPRLSPVLYLAESPEHAVAEFLHPWRGRSIDDRHLIRAGRRLAAVEVRWHASAADVVDLCDRAVLTRLAVPPDRIASRHRVVTQPIAQRVWEDGAAGLRWWSRFWGDWHTAVVFTGRASVAGSRADVRFGGPEPLQLDSPAVVEAADLLGIGRRGDLLPPG